MSTSRSVVLVQALSQGPWWRGAGPKWHQRHRFLAQRVARRVADRVRDSFPAYSSDIFVMDAGGSNRLQLTHDGEAWEEGPAWSPDGDKIVFTGWPGDWPRDDHHGQVWVLERDSLGLWEERLLFDRPGTDWETVFSPDGTKSVAGVRAHILRNPDWSIPGTVLFERCERPGQVTYRYQLECGIASLDLKSDLISIFEDESDAFDGEPRWVP